MSANLRLVISVVLSAALVAAPMQSAHAEAIASRSSASESTPTPAPSTSELSLRPGAAPNILALTASTLAIGAHVSRGVVTTSKLDLVAPTDIRLSRGAKTAIIVTAIVVGVLIIAGVIVLAKPHKP